VNFLNLFHLCKLSSQLIFHSIKVKVINYSEVHPALSLGTFQLIYALYLLN
jgi:hypothetical protein